MKQKKLKNYSLFFYISASVFFMETILRIATVGGSFFSLGVLISLLFSLGAATLLFIICTFFPPATNRRLALALLILMATLFGSQLVYYGIFTTFYTVYSAGQAGQVFQFWREAVAGIAAKPIPSPRSSCPPSPWASLARVFAFLACAGRGGESWRG